MSTQCVTHERAEKLAIEALRQHLKACRPQTPTDNANVLMKMLSCTAVVMTQSVGPSETVLRMHGTAEFIRSQFAGHKQ